jgi:hypothetical protein
MFGTIVKPRLCALSTGYEIGMLTTPSSLVEEHEEIMGSLRNTARFPGETGKAVKELLDVLEPHFEKEEKFAMPVLGSLSDLVSGEHVPNLKEIADSQAPLMKEYQRMLQEHANLKRYIDRARMEARIAGRKEVSDLLDGLAHHARVEEEVLYPAALLASTLAMCLLSSRSVA